MWNRVRIVHDDILMSHQLAFEFLIDGIKNRLERLIVSLRDRISTLCQRGYNDLRKFDGECIGISAVYFREVLEECEERILFTFCRDAIIEFNELSQNLNRAPV